MEQPETPNNNDNQNLEFATSVHFEGNTYYITRDNKVFTLENGNYILSSDDEIKKLYKFLNPEKPYVVYASRNTLGDEISMEDDDATIEAIINEIDSMEPESVKLW